MGSPARQRRIAVAFSSPATIKKTCFARLRRRVLSDTRSGRRLRRREYGQNVRRIGREISVVARKEARRVTIFAEAEQNEVEGGGARDQR